MGARALEQAPTNDGGLGGLSRRSRRGEGDQAEGTAVSENISPVDWIARCYVKHHGVTIDRARDLVILRCLKGGDASVFSYFVLVGHRPGEEVLRTMALMTAEQVSDETSRLLPFRLSAVRRDPGLAGKRPDPLIEMRDEVFALNVKGRMDDGVTRDAAANEVAEMISRKGDMSNGRSRWVETVLKAYKLHARQLG
jgi:hypothetical protein